MTLPTDTQDTFARSISERYRIEREIGRGGMATVYLAEDLKHHRKVAIKVLSPQVAADIGSDRFLREIEIAAGLAHPHIVPLHDSGALDGQLYYVMPYIEGESLRARIHREGKLPLDDALRLTSEVASALGFAHTQGLIHRDIKPENVLLAHGIALVADFGIARSTRAGTDATLTQVGTVVGTPHYMSPEQAAGALELDARSDIYSLACVLYEMLSGEPPFTGPTASMVLAKHALEPPPFVRTRRPDVPESVEQVMRRALAKAPADRPPSAARFAEMLSVAVLTATIPTPSRGLDAPAAPSNLTRQRTSFVGRERELADCARLLAETRLLTLTGIGGCGKSRLALRLAETIRKDHPDGVWTIDLATVSDPTLIPQTLARAMGLSEEAGRDTVETLAEHLRDRRVLMVLDNCEHLIAPSAALVDSLMATSSQLYILATTRERLGVEGERVYEVRPLGVPAVDALAQAQGSEAVQLFVARTRQILPNFTLNDLNAPSIAEICRSLDGLPLAIELAAARMKLLTPESIRDRLEDRFRLLTGSGRSAQPRQQTLRAAIQWSYDQLAEPEQRLLAVLTVFTGGWTLEAAYEVAAEGQDEFEVLDLLARLVDRSLVVVDHAGVEETRYRMLETVRQFAAERLEELGAAKDARARHFTWYLKNGVEANARRSAQPLSASAMRWMTAEYANMCAALDNYLAGTQRTGEGLRLALALSEFCASGGHLAEAVHRITRVLDEDESASDAGLLVLALRSLGNLSFRRAHYDVAARYYERSLEVARRENHWNGVAGALGSLGNVAHYTGQLQEAQRLFEETREVSRAHGLRQFEANSLTCLGNLSADLGDFAGARSYLEKAFAINTEIGAPASVGNTLENLAIVASRLKDHEGARSYAERAVEVFRQAGDPYGLASTTCALAEIEHERHQMERSDELFRDSLRVSAPLGDPRLLFRIFSGMAVVTGERRHFQRAARLWGAAESMLAGGFVMSDIQTAQREQWLATLRNELGSGFDEAFRAGEALSQDHAVALALADATD